MNLKRFTFAMLCAAGLSLATAQEQAKEQPIQPVIQTQDWHIGLGGSYRNFHNPSFRSAKVPDFNGIFSAGSPDIVELTDDSILNFGVGGPEIVNIITYVGGTGRSNGHFGFGESLAPVISFSTGLFQKDALAINFVANIQYYALDSESRRGGEGTRGEYTGQHNVISGVLNPVPMYGTAESDYLAGFGLSAFKMDLYVLDLGLSAEYTFQNGLQAFVAAGPSLSIANMESTSLAGVGVAGTEDVLAYKGGRDNDFDYIFGLYLSAGASYWFTEQVGISAEVRYDEAFKHADTQFVSQDLDGMSGMVKCLFRF